MVGLVLGILSVNELPCVLFLFFAVPSTEHSLAGRSSAGTSPAVSIISPNQSSIERDDSRLDAVVTSSSSGRGSELLYSADNVASSEIPAAQPPLPPASLSSSSPGIIPPTADESGNEVCCSLTPPLSADLHPFYRSPPNRLQLPNKVFKASS